MIGLTAENKVKRINEPGKLTLPLPDYSISICGNYTTGLKIGWTKKNKPPNEIQGFTVTLHFLPLMKKRTLMGRWNNENSDAWEVQRNWDGHIQSKHTSIQFPLLWAYLACNFFWLALAGKRRRLQTIFPSSGSDGHSASAWIQLARSLHWPLKVILCLDKMWLAGNYMRCYIDVYLCWCDALYLHSWSCSVFYSR